MGNCYSADHIADEHIHTDITCNIEEPQQNWRGEGGLNMFKPHKQSIDLRNRYASRYTNFCQVYPIRVAERPPVWERAVHSVNCTCLSWAFVKFCVCPSFPFGI